MPEANRSKPRQPKPPRTRTRKASASQADGPEAGAPAASSEPPAPKRRARNASPAPRAAEPGTAPADPALEEEAGRAASEAAFDSEEPPLPSSGLLSFYDRLRERIVVAVERRSGRLGTQTAKALLLVPDIFVLLVRLALDPRVPGSARALIGGAIAYFVLPVDLMPEAILGGAGYLEDLVLAVAVLAHTFGDDLEPYVERHWSGPEDVRTVIADVTGAAQGLLGANVYDRVRGLLKRRGVEVEE